MGRGSSHGPVPLFTSGELESTLFLYNMGNPAQSRVALEDHWRERLQESQRLYKVAKAICAKASRECENSLMPMADGHFAFRQALRVETAALAEYKRALQVFTDLTLNGKMPPPDEAPHGGRV